MQNSNVAAALAFDMRRVWAVKRVNILKFSFVKFRNFMLLLPILPGCAFFVFYELTVGSFDDVTRRIFLVFSLSLSLLCWSSRCSFIKIPTIVTHEGDEGYHRCMPRSQNKKNDMSSLRENNWLWNCNVQNGWIFNVADCIITIISIHSCSTFACFDDISKRDFAKFQDEYKWNEWE